MNTMINATPKQLRKAADIKERIDGLQDELNEILGAPAEIAPATEAPKKKRKMSRAGRARIAAAARKRWAAIRAAKGGGKPAKKGRRKMSAQGLANIRAGVAKRMAAQGKGAAKPVKKAKKKFSAAARAALAAAAKARWAKAKAAGKTTL